MSFPPPNSNYPIITHHLLGTPGLYISQHPQCFFTVWKPVLDAKRVKGYVSSSAQNVYTSSPSQSYLPNTSLSLNPKMLWRMLTICPGHAALALVSAERKTQHSGAGHNATTSFFKPVTTAANDSTHFSCQTRWSQIKKEKAAFVFLYLKSRTHSFKNYCVKVRTESLTGVATVTKGCRA